jgi:hypothetical protein
VIVSWRAHPRAPLRDRASLPPLALLRRDSYISPHARQPV